MRKRILGFVLALSMLFAAVPMAVTAETDNKYGDYLYYEINSDNTVTITNCDSLATEIEIPSTINDLSVTAIGDGAFYDCGRLKSITVPDSVTSIGEDAFYDTAYYNDTNNWENGVLYIGNHLIEAKSDEIASEYKIKDGIKTIGNRAFYGCRSIKSVTIPDSVVAVGKRAFKDCRGITSVAIGNGVTTIGKSAFEGCFSLTEINVSENNAVYSDINGVLFNKDKTQLICYPTVKTETSYIIPNGVTDIKGYAFDGCTNLKSVTIPDSVTDVGKLAFLECVSLAKINVSENNTVYSDIDGALFNKDKTELICYPAGKIEEAYILPDSVTNIGSNAFYGCSGLKSITVPDSVTSIGEDAFYDTAYYNDTNNWENGVLYIGNHLIETKSDEIASEYKIKDGIKTIGNRAFYGCRSIKSVTIPDSVTTIGESAFYWCSGLNSITIPDSVVTIGKNAFDSCKGLTSVTIGKSVTTIGKDAFWFCHDLNDVYYTGTEEEWRAIEIGDDNDELKNAVIHYNSVVPAPLPLLPSIDAYISQLPDTETAYNFDVIPQSESIGEEYSNCYVCAAIYDGNGVLLGVSRVPLKTAGNTTVSVDKTVNAATAKVFVWSDTMQPIVDNTEGFDLTE